jgi:hypothetical protein
MLRLLLGKAVGDGHVQYREHLGGREGVGRVEQGFVFFEKSIPTHRSLDDIVGDVIDTKRSTRVD